MTKQGDMIKAYQALDDALDDAREAGLDRDEVEHSTSEYFAGQWSTEDVAKGYQILIDGLAAAVNAGLDPVDVSDAVTMHFDAHLDD